MKKLVRKLYETWRKFWKWVFTLPLIQWVAAAFMYLVIRLIHWSCRIEYRNKQVFKQHRGKPVIFAFWHGRSMMLTSGIKRWGRGGYAIFSRHRDGRLMAKLQRMFGLRGIYGSTGRRGAVQVLREGVKVLSEGNLLAISPDGPKGPRMRVHDGVLYFARKTGAPIIPVCFSCSSPWFQSRWDKYLVATPFSKIILEAGEPFYVRPDDDMEVARKNLEQIMITQLHMLDIEFGHGIIQPAEEKPKEQ
ncbi:MAG: lysophospholipid acyltransferase family protein [Alphaproteobacteria bacterium]|nr:lysophospholipid acyltransferase family protein [Alphaproteobacteria bacterium]